MKLVTNVSVWVALAVSILFFVPFFLIIPRQEFFEGINACCTALAAGVLVGYGKAAWGTMRMPIHGIRSAELLVVGMVVCSIAIVGVFGGLWMWRIWDKPVDLADSWYFAFPRYVFIFGAFAILLSAQSQEGVIGIRAYGRAGLYVAAAILAAATLISLGIY